MMNDNKTKTLVMMVIAFTTVVSSFSISAAENKKSPLPEIPQRTMTLEEATRLRDELELIRNDTELKIKRLNESRQAYELSKKDVEARLRQIQEERNLLDETIQKEKSLKEERLKGTVEFVLKLDPKKAAPILETMDRDLVIALFVRLPPRNVTSFLANMSSAKATQYLEYFSRIRSGREFELLRELGLCSEQKDTSDEKKLLPNTK